MCANVEVERDPGDTASPLPSRRSLCRLWSRANVCLRRQVKAALNAARKAGVGEASLERARKALQLVEGLDNPLLLQLTKADNRAGLVMLREGGVTTYLVDVAGPLVKSFMYQAMQAGLLAFCIAFCKA